MQEQSKVVVIDDERWILQLVCEALEDEGIRAVPCAHGNKALWCIYGQQPSLVMLDVQMPGMSGIEIFQQMRAHPQTMATPVIFLTANWHLVDQQLPTYKEQNAALLPKPFDVDTLLNLAKGFLGHH